MKEENSMNRKKITAFFLGLCLCMTGIVYNNITEVSAETEDDSGRDNFWDNTPIGKFLNGIADIWNLLITGTVPQKEYHILNQVTDQKYTIDFKYHEKKTEPAVEEERDYRKWFDLELYKNRFNLIGGFGGTITGEEVFIPESVPQTGIIGECTNINYVGHKGYGQGWVSPCRELYDLWVSKGETTDRGIATIDGYYLVGVRPIFATHGDIIGVHLEDGTEINCLVFDIKGTDAQSEWGHVHGGKVSVVEWEFNGPKDHVGAEQLKPDLTDWKGKRVVSIVNGGPYVDGLTGPGGSGAVEVHKAEDDDPFYEFKTYGDLSGISEVGQAFMDTQWAALDDLLGSIQVETSIRTVLSDEIQACEDELEKAATEYGFPVYKELFKAVAEYRHKEGDPDIFRIEDTGLNPYPGKKVSKKASIKIAAELFSKCLERANYPNPSSIEDLKALLQAFEFESVSYIGECNNKYSIQSAEEYASKRCKGKLRGQADQIEKYGKYDFKDQKFPQKVLKYYFVISVDMADMPADEQTLLTEAMASWPADLDPRRKAVIEKGLSIYGKISYSMDINYRLKPNVNNPAVLDCSSFTGWAFNKSGLSDVAAWWATGSFLYEGKFSYINKNDLIPGDVALLNTVGGGGANHIGIYIGKSSNGSNVWLHCTGFHKSSPYGPDGRHSLNRGIMITDDTGRVEGYVCNWGIFMRYKGFGNK